MTGKKRFKYMFDMVQAIVFPVLLVITAYFFISQGWVDPEAVGIVWAVIFINVIATIASILVAAWYVEK